MRFVCCLLICVCCVIWLFIVVGVVLDMSSLRVVVGALLCVFVVRCFILLMRLAPLDQLFQ